MKNHDNPKRTKEKNKVGNVEIRENKWIYSKKSHVNDPSKPPSKPGNFSWHELLCIEFNPEPGIFVYLDQKYNDLKERNKRTKSYRRYLRPDLILYDKKEKNHQLTIIDFKNVSLDFYHKNSPKYRNDIIKQLTYELALQQSENTSVEQNCFFIPYYFQEWDGRDFDDAKIDIKKMQGMQVMKVNFMLTLKYYIE